MKLLVTGGTGFIGSHLAEAGRRRGAEVVVLGLTDRPEEQANTELLRRQGIEVLGGSITDEALCRRAVQGATHVFHLAVAMREGGKRDDFFESVNLEGTRRLLEASVAEGVQRFVYCSTIGIFGHRVPGVTTEATPLAPGNIYERTKVSAEALVREVGAGRGLPYVILRPADVYGPRDQRLLKLFAGVNRGRFPLFGRGDGRRHMIYVDDVVSGFFKACERDEALGQALILAGPRPCTLRELIAEVQAALGRPRFGRRLPLQPMLMLSAVVEDVCQALGVDPPIYRRRMDFFWSDVEFDTSRARRVLDWAPTVDLPEGIRRTRDDYRRAGALPAEERAA
ncbi:MAG TPA: NAD(P)-dependent oxidoreductase [Gemmatimonadales bacterium]|jgi:nucleoside-diphosphate-sugar epimerase|nr:NAD(P)-dependent oxidoreductase [Gemmatimonadales bacterium]